MNQQSLFYSDTYAALRETAKAIGMKKAGYALRPELGPDKAGDWLRDCLDPKRREVLPPHCLVGLLRLGQEAGIHDAMWHICDESSYDRANPVNPEQQVAELQKDFLLAVERLKAIHEEIQRKSEAIPRMGPARAPRRVELQREVG